MRPCKYLNTLHSSCTRNVGRLRKTTLEAVKLPDREADIRVSYVVLELVNTWPNFTRAYYMSCFLSPKTIMGKKITLNLSAPDSNGAISIAMQKLKPLTQVPLNGVWKRRDEPAWHDHNHLLTLSNHVGVSHLQDVRSALSNGFTVFSDLPVLRNFFAHRNQATESNARRVLKNYGILARRQLSQLILTNPIGRPQPLLLDWLDEIELTVWQLCE